MGHVNDVIVAVVSVSHQVVYLIDISDLADVLDALRKHEFLITQWELLGVQLGLHPNALKVIEAENRSSIEQCLCDMLSKWLKLNYNFKEKGRPSWQGLVVALGIIRQAATADKIAQEKCLK